MMDARALLLLLLLLLLIIIVNSYCELFLCNCKVSSEVCSQHPSCARKLPQLQALETHRPQNV